MLPSLPFLARHHMPKSYVGDDGKWQHSLRQSWLSTASQCPEKGRRLGLHELPFEASERTIVGTAVHWGIEQSITHGQDPVPAGLDKLDELMGDPEVKWLKWTPEHCWDVAEKALSTWRYEPTLDVRSEFEFDLLLWEDDERIVKLTGTMDLVEPGQRIADWKIGAGRRYVPWELQRFAVQPSVYVWAWEQLSDERLPFEYVIFDTDELQWQDPIRVRRRPKNDEWLKHTCVTWAKMIEAELEQWPLVDTGWHCSPDWCSAWDTCKGARVPLTWKVRS